jgi:hypothetical protein
MPTIKFAGFSSRPTDNDFGAVAPVKGPLQQDRNGIPGHARIDHPAVRKPSVEQ